MALIDVNDMRAWFNIHADVADARITLYIASASKRLIRWVGATNYADSGLEDELKLAEALIVMHLIILNLNTSIRKNGLVGTESVEGNVQIKYLTPNETAALASSYLEQADEIISAYRQASDLPPVMLVNEEIDEITWPTP